MTLIKFHRKNRLMQHYPFENGTTDDINEQNQVQEVVVDPKTQSGDQNKDVMGQPRETTSEEVEQKKEDMIVKRQQAKKKYEEFLKHENPMVLQMCSSLFSNDP